ERAEPSRANRGQSRLLAPGGDCLGARDDVVVVDHEDWDPVCSSQAADLAPTARAVKPRRQSSPAVTADHAYPVAAREQGVVGLSAWMAWPWGGKESPADIECRSAGPIRHVCVVTGRAATESGAGSPAAGRPSPSRRGIG